MANIQKLEAVLEYIRTHPKEHDQGIWAHRTSCGTAMCMAGTAVALEGHKIIWPEIDLVYYQADKCLVPDGHKAREWGENFGYIWNVAEADLELTSYEADILFEGDNSLQDLEAMVENLANGRDIGHGLPDWEDDEEEVE